MPLCSEFNAALLQRLRDNYCPEVKSVEEVVSSEIEEVICCFFLNPPSALSLQRAGKQFSAQICRGHDWRSRGIILILVVEAPVNNCFEINLSPSGNATHWLQSQINSSRKMARGCSVRLDAQKIYDLRGCRGQLRQKKRFNENISTRKHRRAEPTSPDITGEMHSQQGNLRGRGPYAPTCATGSVVNLPPLMTLTYLHKSDLKH